MSVVANATYVLGIVVLSRHGDRILSYESPSTYDSSYTTITPVGEKQAFALGSLLRSRYITRTSSLAINTLSDGKYLDGEAAIMSDASGEEHVNYDTAMAVTQGLWPATNASNITIAGGSIVRSPLEGYQYVPVEMIRPDNAVFLDGWTDCLKFREELDNFYDSAEFAIKSRETTAIRQNLQRYVGPMRSTSLQNMWNVYDYINVNSLYSTEFASTLEPDTLSNARELASWLTWNSFSDSDPNNIANVAGRTLIPKLLSSMGRIANVADPLKLVYYSGSYKPFTALFRMMNVTALHPELAEVVDYTSSIVFEVRRPFVASNVTDLYVRLTFRSGTEDRDLMPYPIFDRAEGDYDIPLAEFRARLEKYGIPTLADWCNTCNTYKSRNCDVIRLAALAREKPQCIATGRVPLSPLAAGFIGVGATLAFIGLVLGLLTAFGMIGWFGRKKRPTSMRRRSTSVSQIVVNMTRKKTVSGDTESGRGVVSDDREFEMMDDVSVKSGHHGLGKEVIVKY